MKITDEQNKFFIKIAEPIIKHEEFQKLKNYVHHYYMTRYEHCLHVAYRAYVKAVLSKKNVDLKSIIRGALLHDFYFYSKEDAPKDHLEVHPETSIENCVKYFEINEIEHDVIISHMWPVGRHKPIYKESFFVNKADKICAIVEIIRFRKKFLKQVRQLIEKYFELENIKLDVRID